MFLGKSLRKLVLHGNRKLIMKNTLLYCSLIIVILNFIGCTISSRGKSEFTISEGELYDKIRGGWSAKVIGCTYAGPVEFTHNGTIIQDYTPIKWSKDRVQHYFDTFPGLYDDIYVNIVFVNAFERWGLDVSADSVATAFANTNMPLWHANQVAKYNIKQGIMPPLSGHWLNNPHADDIDFQIEADFAGLMSPGMPNTASEISDKIGHIFTYGDGWYGGVYTAALYSMAFVVDDVEVLVKQALETIPKQSDFYQCISDVITWYEQYPGDWKQTWFEAQKKWTSEVGCPDGVFLPFDIDAKINSAYVTIGLLYGEKDFYQTMDIAARCGQDSDCNAATAAGVLGTMIGYQNIPERWKESLYGIEKRSFAYTDISLDKLCDLSMKHALSMVERKDGEIIDGKIIISSQRPVSVAYEKSFEGHYPVDKKFVNINLEETFDLEFGGNGFVLRGAVLSAKQEYVAKIELYVDEHLVETANLPVSSLSSVDNRRPDLFYQYQLSDTCHKVRLKWLNPDKNVRIYIGEMLVYKGKPDNLYL